MSECRCPAGRVCDCHDLRSILWRVLTEAEYGRMEAEGLAADALGLRWSESQDRWIGPNDLLEGRMQ